MWLNAGCQAEDANLTVFSLEEFMALSDEQVQPAERQPTDLIYYMYTSGTWRWTAIVVCGLIVFHTGTTGNPKGVMLTNRNMLSNVAGLNCIGVRLYETDVYLRYITCLDITCLDITCLDITCLPCLCNTLMRLSACVSGPGTSHLLTTLQLPALGALL
jgi:acyl-CoA synthetase (AMP-forming)/AMP-acid ligase II